MKKVPETHRLLRRNNVWYYRRRVPLHLVGPAGKKFVQLSLDTVSLTEAKKRRTLHDLEWDAKFDALENGSAISSSAAEISDHSELSLIQLVRDYVDRTDRKTASRLLADGPADLMEKREMEIDNDLEFQLLTTPGDLGGPELVYHTARRILKSGPGPIAGSEIAARYGEIVQRGLIELTRRKAARLDNDFSHRHFDHLFDPDRPPEVTFGDLARQHIAMKREEAQANSQSTKSIAKIEAHVAVVREIVGDQTTISAIDYDTCLRVRSIIAQLPVNRTKHYPKLPIEKAIQLAKADGRSPLSFITQSDYLRALKDVLDLAFLKRLLPNNPATSLQPLKRDQVPLDKKRLSFDQDQVRTFLTSDFYQRCAPDASEPYSKPDRDWRFWLPLICAFMGMRPLEVCQLLVSDIQKTAKDTVYIDVAETTDDAENVKTIKTTASRRKIPVHPELINIGLLQFVEARRKEAGDKARLFANLKPDGHGNLATYALKRFRESFLSDAITVERRQSFYSFRHSFRDALRRCEAPASALKALGGWTEAKAVSDHYGTAYDPDHQAQWIAKIAYEGLDLSFLRAKQL